MRADGPCPPDLPWTPLASEAYLTFWRTYTDAPRPESPGGARTWTVRRMPAPRVLALDEPPGLAELAASPRALLASGRTREALDAAEVGLARAPGLPALLALEGDARLRRHEAAAAMRSYARALALGGPVPELYVRLAAAQDALGDHRGAADSLERAAGFAGTDAALWRRAGRALAATGRTEAAAAARRRADALGTGR